MYESIQIGINSVGTCVGSQPNPAFLGVQQCFLWAQQCLVNNNYWSYSRTIKIENKSTTQRQAGIKVKYFIMVFMNHGFLSQVNMTQPSCLMLPRTWNKSAWTVTYSLWHTRHALMEHICSALKGHAHTHTVGVILIQPASITTSYQSYKVLSLSLSLTYTHLAQTRVTSQTLIAKKLINSMNNNLAIA